jgi:UDP-3-O-[3-hydroxymyristoyl] glucosamine N-acyltransferase
MKLSEIAQLFNGRVVGNGDVLISGVKGIEDAKEGDITYLASAKHKDKLKNCQATAIIVNEKLENFEGNQLIVDNPKLVFVKLLQKFYLKPHPYGGISNQTFISDSCKLGENVTIYPFSYVGDNVEIGDNTVVYSFSFIGKGTKIGADCIVYPNVTIREGVQIGNRVIIHPSAVIGADGFGYIFYEGKHEKIPQVGSVVIEDDVEIGAGTTIDRATTGRTVIGKGTKIDNLVQIGHNVEIGQHCIIVAQVGIGGSSKIGDGCIIAGQVGISDHVEIESGTTITAQSGVMPGKVEKGVFSGTPIIPHRDWLRASSFFKKLPELNKKLRELEEKIKKLEVIE